MEMRGRNRSSPRPSKIESGAVRAFLQVPRWRLPSKDQVTIRVLYKGCNRVPLKSYYKATLQGCNRDPLKSYSKATI